MTSASRKLFYTALLVAFLLTGCINNSQRVSPVITSQTSTLSIPEMATPTGIPTSLPAASPTPLPSASFTPAPATVSLDNPVWIGRGQIFDAAFLPDGTGVLVAWRCGISLVALKTGKEVWYIPAQAPLISFSLQSQGSSAAAMTSQGMIMIIDLAAESYDLYPLPGQSGITSGALAWSPDGQHIAFQFTGQDWKEPVYILDINGRQVNPVPESTVDAGTTALLSWSPDGKTIAISGDGEKCPRLVDVISGKEQMSLGPANNCLINRIEAWSPDGKAVEGINPKGDLVLLGVPSGKIISKVENPGLLTTHPVIGPLLCFNNNGRWIANVSAISSNTSHPYDVITIWNIANGGIVARNFHLVSSNGAIYRVAISFKGYSMLMIYSDGTVTRWDFLDGGLEQILFQLPVPSVTPWTMSWSANSNRVAFLGNYGGIFVYDTHSGQEVSQIKGDFGAPALSPDGSLLSVYSGDQLVIDLAKKTVLWRMVGKDVDGGTSFSPDGTYLAYGLGKHAAILDLGTGISQELIPSAQSEPASGTRVMHLVWSPDSQSIAVATGGADLENGKVVLWGKDERGVFVELAHVADLDANYLMSIAAVYNPSGSRVALQAVPESDITQTEIAIFDLRKHVFDQKIKGLLMGQWVNDNTLSSVEAQDECRQAHLDAASGQISYGYGDCTGGERYAPGGLYYARVDNQNLAVHILDWQSGKTEAQAWHGSVLIDYLWSPDGSQLATIAGDGTVRIWTFQL